MSASQSLKEFLNAKINKELSGTDFIIPTKELSTDNGAMIAICAYFHKDKTYGPDNFIANSKIKL